MKPTVAITGPRRGAWAPRFLAGLGVRLAGGRPLQVGPGWEGGAENVGAVVVTGGHDIEPVLYAQEPEVESRYDPERDRFEADVIDVALKRHLPILGICRGAQLLNVSLGGSLHQDVTLRRRHTSNRRTVLPLKELVLEPGTRLQQLLDTERMGINSLHRQAIDRLGVGLRVSGRDRDGLVQAVEITDERFIFGTQWHPEFLIYRPNHLRLFRALVRAARGHRHE